MEVLVRARIQFKRCTSTQVVEPAPANWTAKVRSLANSWPWGRSPASLRQRPEGLAQPHLVGRVAGGSATVTRLAPRLHFLGVDTGIPYIPPHRTREVHFRRFCVLFVKPIAQFHDALCRLLARPFYSRRRGESPSKSFGKFVGRNFRKRYSIMTSRTQGRGTSRGVAESERKFGVRQTHPILSSVRLSEFGTLSTPGDAWKWPNCSSWRRYGDAREKKSKI